MRRLLVLAATLAALAVATPAQAANTNVVFDGNGVYVSPATANISGKAICTSPTGLATIVLSAHPGLGYEIAGQVEVVCDGAQHSWATTITGGPFQLNHVYVVHASLTDATGTIQREGKVILR